MGTQEEIARLRKDATPPDAQVWASHYFSYFGSSWAERVAFRDALQEAGFGTGGAGAEVGADEEVTGDGFFHLWAFTVLPASSDELVRADNQAQEIADAHGVRYDEWEVQRLPSGHLRPVAEDRRNE